MSILLKIQNIPKHVAISTSDFCLMDQRKSLTMQYDISHRIKFLKAVIEGSLVFKKIQTLSVFLFPLGWKSQKVVPTNELKIFLRYLKLQRKKIQEFSIKIQWMGHFQYYSKDIRDKLIALTKMTEKHNKLIMNLGINYGGRQEILNSLKELSYQKKNFDTQHISSQDIKKALFLDRPNVDLLILTSRNRSLDNFMLWHIAYAEIVFQDVHWVNFEKENFIRAVKDYRQRSRRFGSI